MAAGRPIISVQQLTKIFGPEPERALEQLDAGASPEEVRSATGSTVAVQDASFEVAAGETFVIMGLSGSGKSTLLRCINRLIEPTRGAVIVDGEDVTQASAERVRMLRRSVISMVFQHFGLFPHRTVRGNVEYGLEVSGVERAQRRARAEEALALVGLGDYAESRTEALSGGMQQRVGLARALANDPAILLMDEPFSALDPLIRAEMQEELVDLQARVGCTTVFITHDLDEALALGDRIAILRDGAVVQVGTPQAILLDPADDYVEAFVQNVDRTNILTASVLMRAPAHVASTAAEAHERVLNAEPPVYVTDGDQTYQGALARSPGAVSNGEPAVDPEAAPILRPDTPLAECMPLVLDADVPAVVLDADGRLLGVVDREAVLVELTRNADRPAAARS
ncbi:MAG: betaine/proline/choline family ABC transporter ATP-binding protein [Bacteroidetes bacterium]|jgi:glycine betaine/proline transport system ATP-binding protein|nr:betaine/proline/choline family ABC transporter ATP-binding protein [Bacteroidota bacterium]